MTHVFLLAQLRAVAFVANARVETRDFLSEMGLGYFLNEPEAARVGGVLLQFKPVHMDPLPLYVILMTIRAGVLSGDSPGMQVLAGMTGVALMAALAAWLDMLRRPRNPLDPAAAHAEAGLLPQGTPGKGIL